ncbi:MAG: tetratricopeptide repeat protein [bacterium]
MKKAIFLFFLFIRLLRAEDTIKKADEGFNNGNFEAAIGLYKEYLLYQPQGEFSPLAQYRIGEGLFKLEKYDEAEKGFKNVLFLYPESEYVKPSLSRLGDCYLKLNKKKEAIEVLKRLVIEYPGTKEAEYATSQLNDFLPKKPTKDETEKIKNAKQLFEKGSYTGSYDKFLSFIKEYPYSTYTPYARFKIAESLYYQEKYPDAIKGYNEFLALHPDTTYTPYAEYSLAWSYFKIQDYDNALNSIKGFLEKNKGEKYYDSGLRLKSEAEKKLEEKKTSELFSLAKESLQKKDLEKAKASLEELLEKYPDCKYKKEVSNLLLEINEKLAEESILRIKELYDNGTNYLKNGKYDEAIGCFQRLIRDFAETEYTNLSREGIIKANKEKYEREAGLKYNEGLKLEKEGKEREARIAFQAVISSYPTTDYAKRSQEKLDELASKKEEKDAESLYKQAISLLNEKDYSRALEMFQKITLLYPDSIYTSLSNERIKKIKDEMSEERQKAQFDIAFKYYELGEYKECARILQNIISIWPSGVYTEKAKNILSEISLKLNSEDAGSLFKMAQSYYENNEYNKAFDTFKKVVELYPQTSYAKAGLLAMGRLNEKIANEKAKEIYDSGKSLQFQKKYDEAHEKFNEILSQYPTSYWADYAQYSKGETYFEMKDYQNAIIQWQGLEEKFKEGSLIPDALYHIAGAYSLLNMKEEAVKTYKRLLLEYPESIYSKGQLRVMIEEKIKELEK